MLTLSSFTRSHFSRIRTVTLALFLTNCGLSAENKIIPLWPDKVPNQTEEKQPAKVSSNNSGSTTRLSKVTDPSLTVYTPKDSAKNGASIIICPGGGYSILAVDKEGYEIAEWLSDLGYTAFVLQYRVPKNKPGALQDAQRSIRTVRSLCKQWSLDPNKIGILGFSAGGSLSARASCRYDEELYLPTDAIDKVSARPDFSVLIYPAYLDLGAKKSLTPELKITKQTPPMFLFIASDDGFTNGSLVMASALKAAKRPFIARNLLFG
jgi:acetyl esterase/lipase